MATEQEIIQQTERWIREVVARLNFCPFAAKEVKNKTIHYEVVRTSEVSICLQAIFAEMENLDQQPGIETTLVIFPDAFADFDDYLMLLDMADRLLTNAGYEGVYQLASFHPEYRFADSSSSDAANYTNRAPYPIIHLLREASVAEAVKAHPDAEGIPDRNVEVARSLGLERMQMMFDRVKEK